MTLAKWKTERDKYIKWLENIQTVGNAEFLNLYFTALEPDDYDGEFTARGGWMYKEAHKELVKRLEAAGFITAAEAKTFEAI